MVDPNHPRISIVRQCRLVSIARSSFYDAGTGESPLTLRLMRLIDEQFLETPFFGSRQMTRWLRRQGDMVGCVATFQKRQESDWSSRPGSVSCRHLEQVVDELNLSPHIRTAHPPRLPLPDHVHGLVALDRSPRRLKLTKPLLGFHASFDRSVILLQDVVQVLDWPVAATASQESFLFHP